MSSRKVSFAVNITFYSLELMTIVGLILKKQYHYTLDTVSAIAAYTGILIFEKKEIISFKNYIRILLAFTMLSHNLIGEYFTLYDTTVYFDKILHAYGTFAIALFLYTVVKSLSKISLFGYLQYFIIVLCLGIASGALFETGEFILDLIFKVKNQKDLLDTNLDMVFNAVGAIAAGIYAARKQSLL